MKTILSVIFSILLVLALPGCRRVTLVGDSLLFLSRDTVVEAINTNDQQSWVYTEHLWGGSTSYNNPINHEIYGAAPEFAFSFPDVVVFSFATNDMNRVSNEWFGMDSAIEAMQALINQAVASGANCIVMFESSHRFRYPFRHGAEFEMCMDDWFDHWHRKVGENDYLGIPYTFLIADISAQIEADMGGYLSDQIHLNEAGEELAAAAIVEQINQCPEGRWIFGESALRPDASYPQNPHREYKIEE